MQKYNICFATKIHLLHRTTHTFVGDETDSYGTNAHGRRVCQLEPGGLAPDRGRATDCEGPNIDTAFQRRSRVPGLEG